MIRPGKTVISDMIYTKRPVGLKFLRREDTNLFQLDKTVPLGGELCKEIPSHGFEALLQSCTTQRLTGTLLVDITGADPGFQKGGGWQTIFIEGW